MLLPFENDTNKVMNKLAKADLKAHKLKTVLSGIIIFISTCLLSVIFMILFNSAMDRKYAEPYDAMYRGVNAETKNALVKNLSFDKTGIYKYFGGTLEIKGRTDISYMDTITMELLGYKLLNGKYPIQSNEILVSEQYLKNHDLPNTIGTNFNFTYIDSLTNKKVNKQFKVSGIIENRNLEETNMLSIITSDAFRQEIAAQAGILETSKFSTQTLDSVDVLIRLNKQKSTLNKEEKEDYLKAIGTSLGVKSYDVVVNYQYTLGLLIDPEQIAMIILFVLFIMFASSFVIYSIFYISIVNSVQTYAQIMSLGTTSKQLKVFLRTQGNILARKYVPTAMLLSLLLTILISSTKWILYDAAIICFCGLLIIIVIKLSLRKPMKTLISISPIEAMKYSGSVGAEKHKILKHITPATLAKNNLVQNKKKNRMSIISISISGILIIAMSIFIGSFDVKGRLLENYPLNEQFQIGLNMDNFYERLPEVQKNNPFTDEFISEINSIVGVDNVIENGCLIGKMIQPHITIKDGSEQHDVVNSVGKEIIANASRVVSGSIDFNSLQKDSILINKFRMDHSADNGELGYKEIKVGDTLKFQFKVDDNIIYKNFKVAGIAYFPSTDYFYIKPETLKEITPYNPTDYLSITCKHENKSKVKEELKNIVSRNPNFILKVYEEDYKIFNDALNAIMNGIYVICFFVLLFGILNMANMLINSAIIRKHEFALLQAVGMTNKQLRKMLYKEGMNISVKSVISSIILGVGAGKAICYMANEIMALKFINFNVPILPILAFSVFVIGLQMIISHLVCKNIEKTTLTERLRTE